MRRTLKTALSFRRRSFCNSRSTFVSVVIEGNYCVTDLITQETRNMTREEIQKNYMQSNMHVLSKPHNHTMFLKEMSDSSSGYMGLQQSAVKLLNLLTVYCIAAAKRTPTNHVLTACVVPSVRTPYYGMDSQTLSSR